MQLNRLKVYTDFHERSKNEPILFFQGSKRSGKTSDNLINLGCNFLQGSNLKIQCFSESPKQQNFGLKSDFDSLFNPFIPRFKKDGTQKTYKFKNNEIAFINIQDNVKAGDIANSLGQCDLRLIDECNMYSKGTFEKLQINNKGKMYCTFNPWKPFWANELITETNFLKTTWKDNPFLTKSQVALFLEWTKKGQAAEVGSYDYWRWQVMCEGIFAELTGEIFTTENIHFTDVKPIGLHNHIIFADPSNAKGGDNFALTLTATDLNGNVYLLDSFSRNKIEKVLIAEKVKEWQRDYPVVRTFIETNGQIGLKFYNDCVSSQISVDGWNSRTDKFERIMANFDVITQKLFILDTPTNREYVNQIYTFKIDCDKDDNIDCLNNAIMAYILVFGELKILF